MRIRRVTSVVLFVSGTHGTKTHYIKHAPHIKAVARLRAYRLLNGCRIAFFSPYRYIYGLEPTPRTTGSWERLRNTYKSWDKKVSTQSKRDLGRVDIHLHPLFFADVVHRCVPFLARYPASRLGMRLDLLNIHQKSAGRR